MSRAGPCLGELCWNFPGCPIEFCSFGQGWAGTAAPSPPVPEWTPPRKGKHITGLSRCSIPPQKHHLSFQKGQPGARMLHMRWGRALMAQPL
eukprot:5742139-Alexandrium_andersonii.AAC.1